MRLVIDEYPEVQIDRPKLSMLKKLETKGMPTRMGRWCCEYLKEGGGEGRLVLTGIRWAESARRSKRGMVEACHRGKGKRYLHPIIDWQDGDVWAFIKENRIPYCKLYDEGWPRIGCLFCPMAGAKKKQEERKRYPAYEILFVKAMQRLKENREAKGLRSCDRWANGQEMFDWWVSNKSVAEYEDEKLATDPIFG